MYYSKNHKQYGCTFVYGLTSIWINAARFRAQVSRLSICPPSGSSLGPPPPVSKGSAELLIFLKVSWLVQKIGSSHICRQQCQGLNASGQHSKYIAFNFLVWTFLQGKCTFGVDIFPTELKGTLQSIGQMITIQSAIIGVLVYFLWKILSPLLWQNRPIWGGSVSGKPVEVSHLFPVVDCSIQTGCLVILI